MNTSIPFQITFRELDSSESAKMAIQERIEKLERFKTRATKCEVIVSKPHRHNSHGQVFHVEIRLHIPGHDLFVTRGLERNFAHSDIYVAIHDAFEVLERRLEDFIRIRRGDVKHHGNQQLGRSVS